MIHSEQPRARGYGWAILKDGTAQDGQRGYALLMSNIQANSDMGPSEVWNHCQLEEAAQRLAKTAMEQLHFSARAYHRTLKLARTIADLAASETVTVAHLAEAIQYRQRELN